MKDMFMHHYILDDKGNPVVTDLDTWCKWLVSDNRHVGLDQIGPYKVSTVFLGLDHNYAGKGPPVLWESMVFKRKGRKPWTEDRLDLIQDRCSGSREQAEAMHRKMVEKVRKEYGNRNKTKARKSTGP